MQPICYSINELNTDEVVCHLVAEGLHIPFPRNSQPICRSQANCRRYILLTAYQLIDMESDKIGTFSQVQVKHVWNISKLYISEVNTEFNIHLSLCPNNPLYVLLLHLDIETILAPIT